MKTILLAMLILAYSSPLCCAATRSETLKFLKELRHSWAPYPLPNEVTLDEIRAVADKGLDTVGITFAAPYCNGKLDFSTLDKAVEIAAANKQKAVLFIPPRFSREMGIRDTLSNGTVIEHLPDRSPNYSILDIFDVRQRGLFFDYVKQVSERYGKDDRVSALIFGWGYQGETGFYNGDWLSNFAAMGSVCAGYSEHALSEFNKWRRRQGLKPVAKLPLPSITRQPDEYIEFIRFRSSFVQDVFQKGYVTEAKKHTTKPVGTFTYISSSPENYARNWTGAPNTDFHRTAGAASSFDITRTLTDSGMGWEDSFLHDGKWNFTFDCMKKDFARQIARGAVHHAMWVKEYETDPKWERGLYNKVAEFIKNQTLSSQLDVPKRTVALYIPTWGASAIRGRSSRQPFVPPWENVVYISKFVGLTESFGVPYDLITEWDLMDNRKLRKYEHLIIPLWEVMPRIIGKARFDDLMSDTRIIILGCGDNRMTRTEFRGKLKESGVKVHLDYDGESITAGRYGNLIYNFHDKPIELTVPESQDKVILGAYEYRIIKK